MNQILETYDYNNYFYKNIILTNKKSKKKYIIIFSFSTIICIIILFFLLYSYFSKLNERKKTNVLKERYQVNTLYSSNNQYNAIKLSNDISIIGLIEIPTIDISYPILSDSNEDLLKISVCRFSGPLPNRIGNLCIAGHNYRNSMMFSKLYKLNINDSIFITDLNNVRLEYIIYEKYKVKENNLNCTSSTNDIQLTLITCNDYDNSERIVVKAKVKE